MSDFRHAITKLKSFYDGESALSDVIACGKEAIPELRAMLFDREPSGLYQARCRAVDALAELCAYDVLVQFLQIERAIADPIERIGEDAVINAAAWALTNVREQRVFDLLMRLAHRPVLVGVIGALGASGNVEAIPVLINGLEEDSSRFTAEAALKRFGKAALPALWRAVVGRRPSDEQESESSARRRRSVLGLLVEIDRSRDIWPRLRPLIHDRDARIAALACEVCFERGSTSEHGTAVRHLIELSAQDDWLLRDEIESYLVAHFGSARAVIAEYLQEISRLRGDVAPERTEAMLRRVVARGQPGPRTQ